MGWLLLLFAFVWEFRFVLNRAGLLLSFEIYFRFPKIVFSFSFLVAHTTVLSFIFPSVLISFVGGSTVWIRRGLPKTEPGFRPRPLPAGFKSLSVWCSFLIFDSERPRLLFIGLYWIVILWFSTGLSTIFRLVSFSISQMRSSFFTSNNFDLLMDRWTLRFSAHSSYLKGILGLALLISFITIYKFSSLSGCVGLNSGRSMTWNDSPL